MRHLLSGLDDEVNYALKSLSVHNGRTRSRDLRKEKLAMAEVSYEQERIWLR